MSHLLPDEVIANVLQTLNKNNVSPLLIKANSTDSGKWDLLQAVEELHRAGTTRQDFLASLLELFLSGHDTINLSDALCVFNVETDVTNNEDMMLWIQGLSVLHSIISSEDAALAPHELLTAVKNSYYCRDDDDEWDLPSFDSMFILRSLLSAHAIQSAESRTRHSIQYSETIRWRRLKSMMEDTIDLFQRMVFEGFDIVNDIFENDQTQHDLTKPAHFITIASWVYTKQLFPACQSLVSLLLEEHHGDGIINLKNGLVAKLFGMLTTLLALECTATPSGDLINKNRQVFATIIDSDEFFSCIRCYGQAQLESGPTLEEDLLLHDRPHCNKFGQAKLAFIRLQTQLHPPNDASIFFPSPLSAEYRWTISFPHVITFLADDDLSNVRLGFDMLKMLVNKTQFIRPVQYGKDFTNSAFQGAHSSELLAQTIHTLLSLVFRISALEATMPNSSLLEFSSLQVMSLTQSLKALYSTNVQVQAIAEVTQKIINSDQDLIALLPKVLDWLRPVIMDICNKSKNSCQDPDFILLCEVIRIFNPILTDLEEVFNDSTAMPKNIPRFFSMIEAYTALFSSLRAMKIFIHTDNAPNALAECAQLQLKFISEWLTQSLDRIILFKESLKKLIDVWSVETAASPPPPGHHRCLLLHYHLEEAVLELSGEDDDEKTNINN